MSFSHLKYTMTLVDADGDDCSESLYRAGAAIPRLGDTGDPLWNAAIDWIAKRRLCLSQSWKVYSFRIAAAPLPGGTESSPRTSLHWRVNNGQGAYGSTQDVGNVVRLTNLYSQNGHVREYAIHGLADSVIAYDAAGNPLLTPDASQLAYISWILSYGGWQLRVLTQSASSPLNIRIKSVAVALGKITFTLAGALAGLTNGDTIIVSGMKGYHANQFNGRFKVDTYDGTAFTVAVRTNRLVDPNFFYVDSSGSMRRMSGTTVNFENINAVDTVSSVPATHKVGNRFAGRRGRRSAQR